MLRDLYLLALIFLLAFFTGWAINYDVPFQIVNVYLFLFGAQYLFLLLMARKVGYRLVDNVLGVDLLEYIIRQRHPVDDAILR